MALDTSQTDDTVESCICLQREVQVDGSPQEASMGCDFPPESPKAAEVVGVPTTRNDLQIYSNTI